MKPHFSIIGDVHGHLAEYIDTASQSEYSLQLGDLTICPLNESKGLATMEEKLDPAKHKFLPGNHDNYYTKEVDIDDESPEANDSYGRYTVFGSQVYEFTDMPSHYIGHFGTWAVPDLDPDRELSGDIFFVRGAWSIDYKYRVRGVSWFFEEELNNQQCEDALALYKKTKPDFVITHCAPQSVMKWLHLGYSDGTIIPTKTNTLLQDMWEYHRPKIWVFGHYHQDFSKTLPVVAMGDADDIDTTLFICLNELSALCFDRKLEIIVPTEDYDGIVAIDSGSD
jgi:hypothetical protein